MGKIILPPLNNIMHSLKNKPFFKIVPKMKLVIQIPCWNEEKTIIETVKSIPKIIEGVSTVEIVVIDDGSTDNTVLSAKNAGVHEIIRLPRHRGLAAAFLAGIEAAIRRDADILVNTDADLQYPSSYIKDIIKPIVENKAEIVIGERLSQKPKPFPPMKMLFQRVGSLIISIISGIQVKDAASGFRALSREAMHSMIIHDEFSYTLESLLLAGIKRFRVVNIPITTNAPKRHSRLFKSVGQYIIRSIITITRIFLMYHPLKFFVGLGFVFITSSTLLGLRFLYYYFFGDGDGHIQSLILVAILAMLGFQCVILGLVADVVAGNRRLMEHIRLRQLEKLNG